MRSIVFSVLISLFFALGVRAQSIDTVASQVTFSQFPIGAYRNFRTPASGTDTSRVDTIGTMFGMNFGYELGPMSGGEDVTWKQSGPRFPYMTHVDDIAISIADPLYYRTDTTVMYPHTAARLWEEAASGNDVRCYLPGTSGITEEYQYPWKTITGGPAKFFDSIHGNPNEWLIPDTGVNSGDYVLRLGTGSSAAVTAPLHLWSGLDAGKYGTFDTNHIGSCTYDFVFHLQTSDLFSVSGTTPLYSIEFWSVGDTDGLGHCDNTFLGADTITKSLYNNTLALANTQAPGRYVTAEQLSKWIDKPGQLDSTRYKYLRHTIPASLIRRMYHYYHDAYGGLYAWPPGIDVRVRTFAQVPIYPRLLRARNWTAQRVLSGAADSILKIDIATLDHAYRNDSLVSWNSQVELPAATYHALAYVHNLGCDSGRGRPLNVLFFSGDAGACVRIFRDQCVDTNAGKAKIWSEFALYKAAGYRDVWDKGSGRDYGWALANREKPLDFAHIVYDSIYFQPAPVPGLCTDSVHAFKQGFRVCNDRAFYTKHYQEGIIGYASEANGGGRGQDSELLAHALGCYQNTPAVPLCIAVQAIAGHWVAPKWSIDSIRAVLADSAGLSSSAATHITDSLYNARIVAPYLSRHADSTIIADSIVDVMWGERFPTPPEVHYQLWHSITFGMKAYLANLLGEDGVSQDGFLQNDAKKTSDISLIPEGYSTTLSKNTPMGRWGVILSDHSWNFSTHPPHFYAPSWYSPLTAALQSDTRELNSIALSLSNLNWLGVVSWPWRDSTPTYLSKLPVKNLVTKNLGDTTDAISYVDFGVHSHPTDSLARYVSVLNRLLWTDSTGTDPSDTRKIAMSVRDSVFNSMYYRWPMWSITNVASGWDTVVAVDSSFAITLAAGHGALLRIAPSLTISTGTLSTNNWNNARHIAVDESNSDSTHLYWMVYQRNGNIYLSSPEEHTEGSSKRRVGAPSDTLIDNSGKAHNPAIAFHPLLNQGIGIVYTVDLCGLHHDTTYLIFRHSNPYTPYALSTDTIERWYTQTITGDPAIVPYKPGTPPHYCPGSFVVTWVRPDSGGSVAIVDTLGHPQLPPARLFASDPHATQLLSPATHMHATAGDCAIAFQESNAIWYSLMSISSSLPPSISLTTLTDISRGLPYCTHRHPCTTIDGLNQVAVSWEAFQSSPARHYAATAMWAGLIPPPYDPYYIVWDARHASFSKTMLKVSSAITSIVSPDSSRGWNDFYRIMWNDDIDHFIRVIHQGYQYGRYNSFFNREVLSESSNEPALPRCTKLDQVPDPVMFRTGSMHSDGTYDVRITRYDFPLTPTRNDTIAFVKAVSYTDGCVKVVGSGGGSPPDSLHLDTSITHITYSSVIRLTNDSMLDHGLMSWSSPSIHSNAFHGNAGDTIKYYREFHVGTYQAGDTVAADSVLTGSTDYIRMAFNLRHLPDSSIVAVLDTCRLTRSGFVSSTSLADSGIGSIVIPMSDSFFVSLDVERGDTNNAYKLARTDEYGDATILDVLPPDAVDSGAFKQTQPTTQTNEQLRPELALHVYPNPATKGTRVCVEELTQGLPAVIEVVSEQGDRVAVLYNDTPSGDLGFCVNFDCSQLLSGTYYVRVYNSIMGKAAKLQVIR